jgi:hypothetical protein
MGLAKQSPPTVPAGFLGLSTDRQVTEW